MRATFVDLDGITTRYLHHGEGSSAIMLLHGVGVSADSWCHNIAAFGDDRFTFAPDLLASGFTGRGSFDKGPPQGPMLDHLGMLVDRLGIKKLTIVGSSFGALIATLFYFRFPARVDRLVLAGCSTVLNSGTSRTESLARSFANGRAAMQDPTLDVCRRRMSNLVHDPDCIPKSLLLMQLTMFALPGALEMYEARMRGMQEANEKNQFAVFDTLEQLVVPTHIVWGREDPRGNLDQAMEAAGRLPNASFELFEACGHLPYLEQPDRFNASVKRFLELKS